MPLVAAGLLAWAALLSTTGVVRAQCGTPGACVEYSPAAAAPGAIVTITPAVEGDLLPVIQSTDCAPGARVNADFVKNGVVVALSPLTGNRSRAQFRVPKTAAGVYRVDLYCPEGNTAVTIEPNFQVLPPDTATDPTELAAAPSLPSPLLATFLLAFAVAAGMFARAKLVALDTTPRFGVRTIRMLDRRLARRRPFSEMARRRTTRR
jgi:hypothetical protein